MTTTMRPLQLQLDQRTTRISTRIERPHVAVSKRLRFEIFRRDNHICYYCGRRPPEVELTIDHVVPTALGGSDVASNLVAACQECNGGKTSIAPDSPLVAQVDEDAARWSAAMQAAIAKAEADHAAVAIYRDEFYDAWDSYRRPALLEENWRQSVENFRTRGLPIGLLTSAVHRAMAMPQVKPDVKFKYMCKVAWNRIREIENDARASIGVSTAPIGGSYAGDVDELIVDTAVAVWRATWLYNMESEPGSALMADLREAAVEMWAGDAGSGELFTAADAAAWKQSTDLTLQVELPLGEESLKNFLHGWMFDEGDEAPDDPHLRFDLAVYVAVAQSAGYSDDSISEAAFWSGRDHTPDIRRRLASLEEISAGIEQGDRREEYFRELSSWHQVKPERIEALRQSARAEYEQFARVQAERKARGENPDATPWGI